MDLTDAELAVAEAVGAAARVDPVGGATHREVGGPAPVDATVVRAPSGIVRYEPADLTICVGAGTTVRELTEVLGAAGQECALDPRDDRATLGGVLSTGLSGWRRLRVGPLRDQVLEVRFVTADGRMVRGGGPTVKNVTGYDLPRLLVGAFGTLGVLTRVVLRCRPRPGVSWWGRTGGTPDAVRAAALRPSALLWDGAATTVLLEGNVDDVDALARAARLEEAPAPPLPEGPHRDRISVPPGRIVDVGRALANDGARWLAEGGVGTVHVATDDGAGLGRARSVAERFDGWMLREAGAPGLDGFGNELPNRALMERIRAAFDPGGKLAPARLPLGVPAMSESGS
jgi:glycolate oxidase FAD binding subunit